MESSNQVQDDFLSIGIELIKKKVELEAVTEELESAEYTEAHPNEYIYEAVESEITEEDMTTTPVTIDELKEKQTILRGELVNLQTKYTEKKPSEYTDINTFNEILDTYILNKENIRVIKKDIETKMDESIKIITILNSHISDTSNIPSKEEIIEWDKNYEEYHKNYNYIDELFDSEKLNELLNENDRLFNLLTQKLYNYTKEGNKIDVKKFYKGIYDKEHIIQLKKSVKSILDMKKDDYRSRNDYISEQKESQQSDAGPVKQRSRIGDKKSKLVQELRKQNEKLSEEIKGLRQDYKKLEVYSENEHKLYSAQDAEWARRLDLELVTSQDKIKNLEKKIQDFDSTDKNAKKKELEDRLKVMEEQIDEKYRTRIDSLISEKSSISAIASIKEEEKEELKKKSEKEKDELKKQIDELKSYLTKSKDELISKKEEFEENVEQLQFQRALIEARANGESDDFLSMLIKSADLYGKPEFQASFDKLLKYQLEEEKSEDKFMFAYVFNEIETKNYDYLEDFLKTRTIPDQPNSLISQIMETSFKSSPQTRL